MELKKFWMASFLMVLFAVVDHTMASIIALTEPIMLAGNHIRITRGHGGGRGGSKGGGGGGASGAIYFCGYIGGSEGNRGWDESGYGGEDEFSPSPEIIKNEIIPVEENEEYYYDHPHHMTHTHSSSSESSCKGWKVLYHPMSKMYPFKYFRPYSRKQYYLINRLM